MSTSAPYLIPPPPGEVFDLANSPDIGDQVISSGIATTVIAFCVVSLRIFTRASVVKSIGLDDYFAIVAMCLSIAFCVTTLNAIRLGAGQHMWYMLISNYSPYFLAGNIGITLTYSASVSFSKLSILIFYLRLSPKPAFRNTVYGLIALVATYTVAYQLTIIFQCQPVAAAWDITIPGECIKPMVPMMTLSIANIVIDLVILLIPVRIFLKLNMSMRQRISLMGLFGAGGFVCAVAIQRTIILPLLLQSSDYTWDVVPQMIWGFLEVNTGVVCAAIPALKPFFTRYIPHFLSSHSHQSGSESAAAPYSTSVDRNRKRREYADPATKTLKSHNKRPSDAYRPSGPATKLGEDEEQLWSPARTKGGVSARTTDKSGDDISLDSLEESLSGQHATRTMITSPHPQSSRGSVPRGGGDGIIVTQETTIGRR